MNKKLKDILDIKSNPDKVYIQDRAIFEDRFMFVPNLIEKGHLEKRSYDTYCELYDSIDKLVGRPDLLIYIRSSIGNLTTQIAKRGRQMEDNLSISYLQGLNDKYEDFANTYDGEMIIIEGDNLKFEDNPQDFNIITSMIENKIQKIKGS